MFVTCLVANQFVAMGRFKEMQSAMLRTNWRRHFDLTNLLMWTVGGLVLLGVVVGSINTVMDNPYSRANWIDFVIFGLAQGCLYALIALGYTLVYGILRMINFAHGEVFMAGAFTGYFVAQPLAARGVLQSQPVLGLLAIAVVAMATSILVAYLLERICYRPLRNAPRLVPLITAIGASLFLQYTFAGLYGTGVKTYPDIPALTGEWVILGIGVLKTQAVVIVAAVVLMTVLYLFVQYTKVGKAMRAVSEDKETAALMGINVDHTIVRTFVIGASLAGAAGVLYALLNKQVQFYMGFQPGLKAFTAAVLGGIGNIPGAMLGGVFLGLFESVGPSLFLEGWEIPAPYQLKDAIAFTMLVLILIFRPTGILGERLARKKA
jgi:branched-chain amino acid transport system permease protein